MTETKEKTKINRREFINLAWLASLGFFIIPFGGATLLFAYPRFKDGDFGGAFELGSLEEVFPITDGDPFQNPIGKFWLIRLEDGSIMAAYKVCPHLGCLYNWQPQEHKFICPCHGSQFQLDGTYILGPAPRSLDRFVVRLLDADGNEVQTTDEEGNSIELTSEELKVVVDTGQLIRGIKAGKTYPTSQAL